MLEKKSVFLIKKFIEEKELSLSKIIATTELTKKMVFYSIDRINEYLHFYQQPLIENDSKSFRISQQTHDFFVDIFLNNAVYESYVMDSEERCKYIFLLCFYRKEEYFSISHFLDALEIGKTTFISDVKKLQLVLESDFIELKTTRQQGYFLEGNEYHIRSLMMKFILNDFNNSSNSFFYDYFFYKENLSQLGNAEKNVGELLKKYNIFISENRFNEFCYAFALLVPRLNIPELDINDNYNFEVFKNMKEFEFSKQLLQEFQIYNDNSNSYLCSWLLSLSLGNIEEHTYDRSIILEIITRMTSRFELISGIRFTDKNLVISNLYSHFRSVYYRLFFKIPIINNLCERTYQEYPDFIQIVEEVLKPISNLFEFPIPKEEIAYLAMHFLSSIDNLEEQTIKKKVGIVVCPSGIGSSAIVKQELMDLFPEFTFMGPFDTDSIGEITFSYDFIFSTVQNVRLYTMDKPVYVVNPIMTPEERYNLIRYVYSNSKNMTIRFPRVSELMNIIERHSVVNNKKSLEEDLYTYLSESNTLKRQVKINNAVPLSKVIKPEYIQFGVAADTFEEAVRICAQPLLKDKVIDPSYLEEIINTIESKNTFMMITNTVALPHTRPIFGANDIGISVLVLDNSISVSSIQKVKYIFMLSAIDNKKHLTAIAQLVKLLDNSTFFEILDNATSDEEIHNYIAENEAKED